MHGLQLWMRPYNFSVQIDYFANRALEAPMKLRPDSLSLRLALFLFVTAAASFATPPAGAAQVAASIEFDARLATGRPRTVGEAGFLGVIAPSGPRRRLEISPGLQSWINRIAHSRTCDRSPGITREHVIGGQESLANV